MRGLDCCSSFWQSEFLWLFIWLMNENGLDPVNSWAGRAVTTRVLVPVLQSWHSSFITSLQHPSRQEWRMCLLFNPISELFCWPWLWLIEIWEDGACGRGRGIQWERLRVLIFHFVLIMFGLPPYLDVCNFVCKTWINPQNASDTKHQEGKKFITKPLIFLYSF